MWADGTKELVSITDGHRESTESWVDVLRRLKRRGMTAPVLVSDDGALGFWAALGEVFPDEFHQHCSVHKMANVMNALPKASEKTVKDREALLAFFDFQPSTGSS